MMKHTSPLIDSAPSRYVSYKRCQFGRGPHLHMLL